MKIVVSIRVRNSEFFEAHEEFKKSEGDISLRDWEVYNDNKIQKYSKFINFEFAFDVIDYKVNKSGKFDIEVLCFDDENDDTPNKKIINLDNVYAVEFFADNKRSIVVVSRELLYQKIHVEKNLDGNEYLYFYIKENSDYIKLNDHVWLSNNLLSTIKEQFQNFKFEDDPYIKVTDIGGFF